MAFSKKGNSIDGWLIVDKPSGVTSTRIVNKARNFFNAAKVGHGGTLDPLATGVLPLAFGEATKTLRYVFDGQKEYKFTVRWGESRNTDDADGTIKLCVSSCGAAQNFHTMIKGVKSTSEFKYLGADLNELENDPTKPWLSSNAGHYAKLNGIMFVELKLDLVFRDGTTSYSTVVYPEAKELLE